MVSGSKYFLNKNKNSWIRIRGSVVTESKCLLKKKQEEDLMILALLIFILAFLPPPEIFVRCLSHSNSYNVISSFANFSAASSGRIPGYIFTH